MNLAGTIIVRAWMEPEQSPCGRQDFLALNAGIITQINWCDYIKLGIWSTIPINNKIMSIDYCGNNKRTQSAVSYAAGVFY